MVENITNLASGLLSKIDFIWYIHRLKGNIIASALLPHQRGGSAPTRAGDPVRVREAPAYFGALSSPTSF